ncbi:MAG: TolC family protein [Bacteroidales bacterium]
MKKIGMILLMLVSGGILSAQNAIDRVLAEIEKNSTTLVALQQSRDAEQLANKSGLFPHNPEVEFHYLWGNPSVIGNRTDFSVKQLFDYPTAYTYKSQLSRLKNQQLEWEYRKQRNELRYRVASVCVELLYHNALQEELQKRHAHAVALADACKAAYNLGDVNVLAHNKAQVHLLQVWHALENNEIARQALLSELAAFNGGQAIHFTDSQLDMPAIAPDFEAWIADAESTNPLLQWVKQEVAIAGKEVRLSRSLGLPKIFAGYMSEKVETEQFRGVSVGISIPLWEHANAVKEAKARTLAAQSLETDAVAQFYHTLKGGYTKAITLQNHLSDYRAELLQYTPNALLQKALDKGEISLPEYLYELSFYYSAIDSLLQAERSFNAAYYELMQYCEY